MTTGCVILPQIWKKIFFSLVFKKIDLPTLVQNQIGELQNEKDKTYLKRIPNIAEI